MSDIQNIPYIVTMADVRRSHMCSKGARCFFEKHNLDWIDFLQNGIKSTVLEQFDDAMVQQVLEETKNGRK